MRRVDGRGHVEVLKSEEKGSDVNLATYLLVDCYRSDCDVAVIVSNDSDLAENTQSGRRLLLGAAPLAFAQAKYDPNGIRNRFRHFMFLRDFDGSLRQSAC